MIPLYFFWSFDRIERAIFEALQEGSLSFSEVKKRYSQTKLLVPDPKEYMYLN